MKKILIGALIVLLCIMAYFAIFRGLSIGSVQILSIEQIANANEKLTQEIKQTEVLMSSDYPTQNDALDKSVTDLLVARDEYRNLASVSTDGEIRRASQQEEYTVEFLLTSLGRHARKEGINLEYTFNTGTTGEADVKNVTFNITGGYIPIMEFVSAIEDDSKLGFRIQNFKILPGGQHLQASFLVMNVKVKPEVATNTENMQTSQTQSPDTNTTTQNPTNGIDEQRTTQDPFQMNNNTSSVDIPQE